VRLGAGRKDATVFKTMTMMWVQSRARRRLAMAHLDPSSPSSTTSNVIVSGLIKEKNSEKQVLLDAIDFQG